ncbi:hypothetical protein HKI87_09g58370 [Chloropicon roscoffensis]|uniref:Uncharacterized protein n=1 Tax=Chloropicon roscoffensis TaxID=1461544 RepID=A0AAX4PD52_9CHLO
MEEGFLQGLLSSTDGSGHDRTNAYAKLYNILCPPQPNLREIAQGFALSEKTSGAEVWESLLDGPGDPIGQAAKKDGGSLEGDSCRGAPQRSSEPLRTVTGFEASSSGSDGGRTGEAQAGKNGPDSSELSIGLLRRKKVMSATDKLPSLRLSRVFC